MKIHCFGSINIDHVHRVPHFPQPGETLSDLGYETGVGGKGANQALAAAAGGAEVRMISAVGEDGGRALATLEKGGVDIAPVQTVRAATGHAIIFLTPDGENQIVVHGGANKAITMLQLDRALAEASEGDWWLCQNETSLVPEAAEAARQCGLKTAYAAAPFEPAAAMRMLPWTDLLFVNELEARTLCEAAGAELEDLGIPHIVVTLGAEGARYLSHDYRTRVPALPAKVVDTTGAGDTFTGVFLAALAREMPIDRAMLRAAAASALQVSKKGAAAAIPTAEEIDEMAARYGA